MFRAPLGRFESFGSPTVGSFGIFLKPHSRSGVDLLLRCERICVYRTRMVGAKIFTRSLQPLSHSIESALETPWRAALRRSGPYAPSRTGKEVAERMSTLTDPCRVV